MNRNILKRLAYTALFGLTLAQPAFADAPKIDTGDTAWMLASTALVMFMTPGLAFFYGGLVRAKNVLTTASAMNDCITVARTFFARTRPP